MESAASGILAGINAARRLEGKEPVLFPATTMLGALSRYIADDTIKNFQPMGAALGLLPPLPDRIRDKRARYAAICERGMKDAEKYVSDEKL